MCNFTCKGRPRNDLYCVGQDIKPYLLTHFGTTLTATSSSPPPMATPKDSVVIIAGQ